MHEKTNEPKKEPVPALAARTSKPQRPTPEQLAEWEAYKKAHPELKLPGKKS